MTLRLILSILAPQIIAFILISAVWPGQTSIRSHFLLKCCLSVGAGLGLLSCVYFLQLSLSGPSRKGLVVALVAVLILAIALFVYRLRSSKDVSQSNSIREPRSRMELILSVLFIVAGAAAIAIFVFLSVRQPHGEWDAWAVYNMKARFLFRAGNDWRDLFREPTGWTSPDYPLLIPAGIAACWTLIGGETVAVPITFGLLFAIATVGVVYNSVPLLRGKNQGLLAGLILVCTPFLIIHGANQYTDVPLGFFLCATLALFHLQDTLPEQPYRFFEHGFLVLAGVMLGLSTWTKNEGFLFLVAIFAARFAALVPMKGVKSYSRQLGSIVIGLVPVLLVVIYFKVTIATPNRMLFPPQGPGFFEKLLDIPRYWIVLNAFVTEGLVFGRWVVSFTACLLFYLLLIGLSIKQKEVTNVVASIIALGIMLIGYFMAFVMSPLDVSGHIATSLNRVLLQLWPSFILVFFLMVRTPDQGLTRSEVYPIS
jgi:Dolichyl-phosphate-mannose-protein mannosyltransferase